MASGRLCVDDGLICRDDSAPLWITGIRPITRSRCWPSVGTGMGLSEQLGERSISAFTHLAISPTALVEKNYPLTKKLPAPARSFPPVGWSMLNHSMGDCIANCGRRNAIGG